MQHGWPIIVITNISTHRDEEKIEVQLLLLEIQHYGFIAKEGKKMKLIENFVHPTYNALWFRTRSLKSVTTFCHPEY